MGLRPSTHEDFMRLALRQAQAAAEADEVPAGCVIVTTGADQAEGFEEPLTPTPVPEAASPPRCRAGLSRGEREVNAHRPAGTVIGRAHNQVELLKDATAHAEMIAITQAAAALGDWRLTGTVLYVTKEPCAMCAGAIVLARIPTVVFGAADPRRGGAVSVFNILQHPALNHRCEVIGGVLEEECAALLRGFFRDKRG